MLDLIASQRNVKTSEVTFYARDWYHVYSRIFIEYAYAIRVNSHDCRAEKLEWGAASVKRFSA